MGRGRRQACGEPPVWPASLGRADNNAVSTM